MTARRVPVWPSSSIAPSGPTRLADGLAELLADAAAPTRSRPRSWWCPARGVERWLTQRLSHRLGPREGLADGVCAGVDFRTPRSLVAEITGARDDDPWAPDALVWPLLDVIDASLGRAVGRDAGRAPRARARRARRASCAAAAATPSPGGWPACSRRTPCSGPRCSRTGRPGATPTACGGAGRRPTWPGRPSCGGGCVDRVGAPPPARAARDTLARLRAGPARLDLPDRLSLFGHTRLPATEVELLAALGEHRDVHLWLPHPSAALWGALADAGADRPVPRAADDTSPARRPPAARLAGPRRPRAAAHAGRTPSAAVDGARARCRSAVRRRRPARLAAGRPARPTPVGPRERRRWPRDDRSRAGARLPRPGPPGRGAARGAARAARGRPDARAARHPRDVPGHRDLRAADPGRLRARRRRRRRRPPRRTGCGSGWPTARCARPTRCSPSPRGCSTSPAVGPTASEVLDLARDRAGAAPVRVQRRRPRPARPPGSHEAGVRWGLRRRAPRATYGLERLRPEHLAVRPRPAAARASRCPTTTPVPGSTGRCRSTTSAAAQIDLVGRLAEFVDRLRRGHRPRWSARSRVDALGRRARATGVDGLTAVRARATRWQAGAGRSASWRAIAPTAGARGRRELRLPDVRALLGHRLAGRPTRANFRTGTLTVCTMVPMRSVPHRVVCLLGLDDGVFPRVGAVDGDDVLARRPADRRARPAQRGPPAAARRVLAATETLVVTYTGADEHTGAPRPPAVPARRAARRARRHRHGRRARRASLTVQHPLQPFDARNLCRRARPGAPVQLRPRRPGRSRGRRRARGTAPPPFLAGPLPAAAGARTWRSTTWRRSSSTRCATFLRQRLDVAAPLDEDDRSRTASRSSSTASQKWGVGDRMLARPAGRRRPGPRPVSSEWRRGVLPPGRAGLADGSASSSTRAEPLAQAARDLREPAPRPRSTSTSTSADGRWLRGTVPEVYGDRLVPVSYSRLGRQPPAAGLGRRCWPSAAADPDAQLDRAHAGRPHQRPGPRRYAGPCSGPCRLTARGRAAASWSTCDDRGLRGAAARCRSRPRAPTPRMRRTRRPPTPRPSARPAVRLG